MLRLFTAFRRMVAPLKKSKRNIIWVDCEMTGLDYNKQVIVEIAVIITDARLEKIVEGPQFVIHQPDSVLENMEEWPRNMFNKNGLMQEIKDSKISMEEAESKLLEFCEQYTPPGKCHVGGNTVYMDKIFINKCMPRLAAHMHYRTIDVSSIKELTRRWYPSTFCKTPMKKRPHRALDDIRESIEELKHYRETVFKKMEDVKPGQEPVEESDD